MLRFVPRVLSPFARARFASTAASALALANLGPGHKISFPIGEERFSFFISPQETVEQFTAMVHKEKPSATVAFYLEDGLRLGSNAPLHGILSKKFKLQVGESLFLSPGTQRKTQRMRTQHTHIVD
jgi:hypothetical protein